MMEKIIDLLHSGGYSCVIGNGTEIRTFTQRGVADLYDLFRQDPSFMKGAGIADKVIGKAAAGLMVLGGIRQGIRGCYQPTCTCTPAQCQYKGKLCTAGAFHRKPG